jgi:hypothetical protein
MTRSNSPDYTNKFPRRNRRRYTLDERTILLRQETSAHDGSEAHNSEEEECPNSDQLFLEDFDAQERQEDEYDEQLYNKNMTS